MSWALDGSGREGMQNFSGKKSLKNGNFEDQETNAKTKLKFIIGKWVFRMRGEWICHFLTEGVT
jgi:hypothetical protein